MVIRSVNVLSAAKVSGALYGAMGLAFGAIFSLVSIPGIVFGSMAAENAPISGFFGIVIGVGAIVFLPIIYGGMGFVMGAFSAWIYNWIASNFGGLEVQIE